MELYYITKLRGISPNIISNLSNIKKFSKSNIDVSYVHENLSNKIFCFTLSYDSSNSHMVGILYNYYIFLSSVELQSYNFRIYVDNKLILTKFREIFATLLGLLQVENIFLRKKNKFEYDRVEIVVVENNLRYFSQVCLLPLFEGCEVHIRCPTHRLSSWDLTCIKTLGDSSKLLYVKYDSLGKIKNVCGGNLMKIKNKISEKTDIDFLRLVSNRSSFLNLLNFYEQIKNIPKDDFPIIKLLMEILSNEEVLFIDKYYDVPEFYSLESTYNKLTIKCESKEEYQPTFDGHREVNVKEFILIPVIIDVLKHLSTKSPCCLKPPVVQSLQESIFFNKIYIHTLLDPNKGFWTRVKTDEEKGVRVDLNLCNDHHECSRKMFYSVNTIVLNKENSKVIFNDRTFTEKLSLEQLPIIFFQEDKYAFLFCTNPEHKCGKSYHNGDAVFIETKYLDIIELGQKTKSKQKII